MAPGESDALTTTQSSSRSTHGATGASIASSLRDDILSGVYQPGERIRQDQLADRHGASRLPVREALRRLEGEGLVSLVANTGAWVSRISMAECDEMYQMREHLEPLLLTMNVPAISSATVDRLARLADEMQDTQDVERFLVLDREFHLSCLNEVATGVLGPTVHNLWNRTQHYRRAATRLFYLEQDWSVHHDHQLLVNAIRRHDVEEAAQVLSRHIRRSRLELALHPEVFE